jgi:hypothetical protein
MKFEKLKLWLCAWVALAETLVILLTGAHVRPHWSTRLYFHFRYPNKDMQEVEEEVLGI